jgi:2-polyprenyl-6-methoxyphenol hydroxylase-like FAD-dependent oxidoreductase
MKNRDSGHDVTVYEQNPPGVTQGWGVVYWDDLIQDLRKNDPPTAREILDQSFAWVDQTIDIKGRKPVRGTGGGYSMRRQRLLDILSRRATELGVKIEYNTEIDPAADLSGSDVVVASGGAGSRLRRQRAKEFGTRLVQGRNKYVWLGTTRVFHSFEFGFVPTDAGWIWFHAYGFEQGMSTLIVECTPETWAGLGFEQLDAEESLARLEGIFSDHLDGHKLLGQIRENRLPWLNFSQVTNDTWHSQNIVLIGDAAHTTHFSIGSGTRLAIQDAIALAKHLHEKPDVPSAYRAYQAERKQALIRPQKEARFSTRWYEEIARYTHLDPPQFSTVMLSRRSPLVAMLPPQMYCRIDDLTRKVSILRTMRRMAGDLYRRVPHSP